MSQAGLHGKLEELGLAEILQILAISHQTGVLLLKKGDREAVLQLRNGLLVRASSTGFRQLLGGLLVEQGVISAEQLQKALMIQQQEQFRERIGTILRERFDVESQAIEDVAVLQIGNVLATLVDWKEGSFECFHREIEVVDSASIDPVSFFISPEVKGEGEKAVQLPDNGAEQPPPPQADQVKPLLLIVDDDRLLSEKIADSFSADFEIGSFTNTETVAERVAELLRRQQKLFLLVDLIIPKADGTGVLGGLDLILQLHLKYKGLNIQAVSDFRLKDVEEGLAAMGYKVLEKPRRGDCSSATFKRYYDNLQIVLRGTPGG